MKTGVASRSADVTRVNRAVVLPERRSYNVERTISLISSDKQSVTGGYYGQGRRMFLIDQRDVDDLDLKQEDWLVYDDHKYEVKHFDEFEAVACWVIIAQRVRGEGFDQIHLTCAEDFAEVGEDASDS